MNASSNSAQACPVLKMEKQSLQKVCVPCKQLRAERAQREASEKKLQKAAAGYAAATQAASEANYAQRAVEGQLKAEEQRAHNAERQRNGQEQQDRQILSGDRSHARLSGKFGLGRALEQGESGNNGFARLPLGTPG